MKSIVMMLCGAFCVLGGIFHSAAGVPALQQELASTNVRAKLAKELIIFWVFMGAAMVTFGGILVTCGLRIRKGNFTGSAMAQWVAGCLIVYDAAGMIWIGRFEPHFFAFVVVGVLTVWASLPGKAMAK
jgi:hypothetical protein